MYTATNLSVHTPPPGTFSQAARRGRPGSVGGSRTARRRKRAAGSLAPSVSSRPSSESSGTLGSFFAQFRNMDLPVGAIKTSKSGSAENSEWRRAGFWLKAKYWSFLTQTVRLFVCDSWHSGKSQHDEYQIGGKMKPSFHFNVPQNLFGVVRHPDVAWVLH